MGLFFYYNSAQGVVAQMPERDVGTAVYGGGHSRPAQPHSRSGAAAGENAPRQDIPLDWVRASSVCIAYRHMPECRSIGGAFF